jgi:hypothetical protein
MSRLNSLLTNGLEPEKSQWRNTKIIFDNIFQHVQEIVFVMKVEMAPRFFG